jgi:transcriptional regulator with XRE-family HTH domain
LADRLSTARSALGLDVPEGEAVLFGAKRSTVYNYEKGVSPPRASYLEGLCTAGVSADYLLRGDGPVLRPPEGAEQQAFRRIARYVDAVRKRAAGVRLGEDSAERRARAARERRQDPPQHQARRGAGPPDEVAG